MQEALYLLAEQTHSVCHSIAFPEMAAPTVLGLARSRRSRRLAPCRNVASGSSSKLTSRRSTSRRGATRRLRRRMPSRPRVSSRTRELRAARPPSGSPASADYQKAEAQRQEEAMAIDKGIVVMMRRVASARRVAKDGAGDDDDDDDDDDIAEIEDDDEAEAETAKRKRQPRPRRRRRCQGSAGRSRAKGKKRQKGSRWWRQGWCARRGGRAAHV